jgi:hypothetical protein
LDEGSPPERGERLWPGLLVVGVLAVTLGVVVWAPWDRGLPVPTSALATPTTSPSLPATVATQPATSSPTTSSPSTTTVPATTTTTTLPEAVLVEAARDALAAWGRFAVSGDLAELRGTFHRLGPQRRLLAREARTISADPPGPPAYTVTLRNPRVRPAQGDAVIVRGRVRFSRLSEPDQVYPWDLVLVPGRGDRWLLWTVRDRSG